MLPIRLVMLSISYTLPDTADIITVIIIFIQLDFASKFEKSKDIEASANEYSRLLSLIYKGKGRLILILDACRSDFGLSKGYYSEITAAEDVYIAYGTQFQYTSIGIANQMSPFTQAICDEILEPNI